MFFLAINQIQNNDELIKEMQDKIISLQDHEVAFLNDTIANIWAAIGIGVGIIVGIAGLVGWIITRSNQNARRKMEDAERVINEAKTYISQFSEEKLELEKSRQKTERKLQELSDLVNSKSIDKLKEDIESLYIKNKISILLNEINGILTAGNRALKEYEKENGDMDNNQVKTFLYYENRTALYEQEACQLIGSNSEEYNATRAESVFKRGIELKEECLTAYLKMSGLIDKYLDREQAPH
ncbi:hypothetical protein CN902_27435 [Priestia megaterium]|uniref:hypothetical protein n=1 Tax=Priestia megaterium TaxID=1404 RepID=UPI000BFBC4A5|nr:hypothetical protein [Priestia megaterium]PGK21413.1 hypothetical protein CN902_27435 [Priestia megaterium]